MESLYIEILNTCSESHKIVECVTQFLNRHQLRVVVIGQTALCSVHHEVARHTIITVIVQISDVQYIVPIVNIRHNYVHGTRASL